MTDEARIDQDAPGEGDAFVIRIEAASGQRLKAIVKEDEVAGLEPSQLERQLVSRIVGLVAVFLLGTQAAHREGL